MLSLLFASTYWDRWTSATKNDALVRSKKTVSAPTAKATASRCHIASAPSHQATGNRRQRDAAQEVGDDHVLPTMGAPVDPDARGQREEQVRKPGERREDPDLERGRVQREHGGQRDRKRADLVAENGDRLACPEPDEVPVAG